MKVIDKAQVEAAWIRFETLARQGERPDIWEAIAPLNVLDRREVAVEFAMIDLEWRWRLSLDKEPRDFTYYVDLLSTLQLSNDHLLSLLRHEYSVRSLWGDRPTLEQMVAPVATDPEDAIALYNWLEPVLDECFPVVFQVSRAGQLICQHALRGQLEVGRQRPQEPASPAVVETTKGIRQIVADPNELDVSQCHLKLKRTSIDQIEFTLTEPGTSSVINSERLNAKDGPRTASLPAQIAIADYELALDFQYAPAIAINGIV